MHDKQVRRRRAVLALLVGTSLILLTAYFGESPNSPLHSVQRGIVEVFAPIQKGASKVLSPFGDVAGWVSNTVNAKSDNATLRNENATLTAELAEAKYQLHQAMQARGLLALDTAAGSTIRDYSPIVADVIGRDPSVWYQQFEVDEGTDDGVGMNDPVVAPSLNAAVPGGLVGDVTAVGRNWSEVTELTGDKFAVGAEIDDPDGDAGILQPAVGNPNSLLLEDLPPQTGDIQPGKSYPVVTSGFEDPADPVIKSWSPPGIPIGYVSSVNENTVLNQQDVTVTPYADLHHLSIVQILTRAYPSATERASLTAP